MPIIAKRVDNNILESSLSYPTDMTGKYELAYPDNLGVLPITKDDYIYPRDNGNVVKQKIEPAFLSAFPIFENVIYNPLLDTTDLPIDDTITFPNPNGLQPTRYFKGETPNTFGVLKNNTTLGYNRGGFIATTEIDIGALTNGVGAQTFMLYWRGVERTFGFDSTTTPNTNSVNAPATLTYGSADLLRVYISNNNGVSYVEVTDNLTPVSFPQNTTSIRVAFINEGSKDVTLLSYAIMC